MEKVSIILNDLIQRHKSPSVQYVFFNKDSQIYHFQSGYSDVKDQIKTDPSITYNAYSVTKTFTALAILQLAQKGKLNINEPVIKYLPGFPYSNEISIRQLISHSAGIPNPIPLRWVHLKEDRVTFDRNEFFNPILAKKNKAKSLPNKKFTYSNLGYVILGQLIEKVSGLAYEDYIRRQIIQPLNIDLKHLDFIIHEDKKHAKGYHMRKAFSYAILGLFFDKRKFIGETEGKWASFKNMYVNGPSYGGLIGTPDAFMKYIQELLKSESSIISPEFKKMLFEENHTEDGKATGMCLAWFTGQLNGKQYFNHAGGGGGYYCEIRIYPEQGLGSVIMFNRSGMKDERFLDKVDRYFFE